MDSGDDCHPVTDIRSLGAHPERSRIRWKGSAKVAHK